MPSPSSISELVSAQRILVLGSSGSGKTTFCIELGRLLKIHPIHLDAHFWQPGWVSTPQLVWRETVASLVREESWIMDGTYESSLDLRIPAADVVIMVERSRWSCLWGILKRKLTLDDLRRPDAPPGQRLDRAFLRYVWQYPTVTRPVVLDCLQRYGPEKAVIELFGTSAVRGLLQEVQRAVESNR